jgi:hypothetical protein
MRYNWHAAAALVAFAMQKKPFMKNVVSLFAVVLVGTLALVSTGCAGAIRPSAGDRQVKAAVSEKVHGKYPDMDVDARNGTVYLMGSVKSAQDRATAEQFARETPGVRAVVNNVYVGPYVPA